jgi:tetratricopeptide (TPR) repeat protein
VPETISHYRILHSLGSGGMGEVYAGIDETLRRRVALKAIHAEHRLSADSKARFLREARILSQLDHPNICRVYDFIEGTDSDWLVLELIEGKSLQSAIAAGLPPATRLRIAQQIADVLVATHSAGVVHRDLKPANVMLTRLDEVKVLDFGLAHSSERTGFEAPLGVAAQADQTMGMEADPSVTRSHSSGGHVSGAVSFHVRTEGGVVMGTPAYMSPEQARGEPATPASDLYSFGLMLQELYSGRAPYPPGISLRELLERARNGDTLPPTGAPADIAALIGRLKQLVPAQRPTAAETAARLVWVRDRRRRIVRRLLVAGVLLTAVLGAAKYTIDLARERTRAVAAREEADRRRTQAEDLIGFMLGDLRKRLEPVGRLEILDDVGQKAMAYFAAVPESALSDEELLRRSAALYQIGDVRIAQGNLEAATPPLQESLALARILVERKPNDGDRLFGLAQSHFWVGFVHWRRHNLDAAESEFKTYLDVANRLTAIDARRDDWRREVAYANSNLGSVLEARGNLDAALVRYRACLAIEQELLQTSNADKDLRHSAAASHNAIGVVLRSIGKFDEALTEFRSELAIRTALLAAEPANATFRLRLGVGRAHVGHVLAAQGKAEEAIGEIRQAVELYRGLVAQDAANRAWRRELSAGQHVLAGAYLGQGRTEAAVPLLRESIAIMTILSEDDPTNVGWRRDLADHRRTLGSALLAARDLGGAAREGNAVLEITSDLLRRDAADIHAARIASTAHALVAQVWTARREPERARHEWELAHESIAKVAAASKDYRLLDPLVVSLLHLNRTAEAVPVLGRLSEMGYRELRFLRAINDRGSFPPPRASSSGG